jgi:hypothetical protein
MAADYQGSDFVPVRRLMRRFALIALFIALLGAGFFGTRGDAQPNTVKQIAAGVWFREGDIEHLGHCNNVIIEMDKYLIVVDANFPSGARAVLKGVMVFVSSCLKAVRQLSRISE